MNHEKKQAVPYHLLVQGYILLLIFIIGLYACSGPSRITYTAPPQPADTSWSAILQQPGNITLIPLVTGEVLPRTSDLLNTKRPEAANYPGEGRWLQNVSLLVRHPDRGDYLINTGYDSTHQHHAHGNVRGLMKNRLWKARQQKGQDMITLLEQHNARLKGVFLENLNIDHIASVPYLPKDIPYVAGRNERYMNVPLLLRAPFLKGVPHIQEIDFSKARRFPPLGPAVDLFGDRTCWAISTPGITKGHLSFLILTQNGPVLYMGEAANTKFSFEHGIEGGYLAGRREDAVKSLQALQAFAKKYPGVKVIYGKEIE